MRFLRIAPIAFAALAACSSDAPTKPVEQVTGICLCGPYVTPASAMLNVGDRVQLTVSGWPGYTEYRWRSSNPAIASVDSMTGLSTGVSYGSATIIAAAVKDRTVQGAAVLTVGAPGGPMRTPVLQAVNVAATGQPADLNALAGDIDVVAGGDGTVGALITAMLVVNNGSRDTTVATQTLAAGAAERWTLRWATAARSNGAAAFPNGQYTLRVVFPSSSATIPTTRNNAIVVNP